MSSVPDGDPETLTGAARVGAELRAARQRLGWDIGDLAQSLRIKLSHLQAIEDGRPGDLPGPTYAMGFLRTYATALGLNAEEVVRRFRAEAQEVNRRTELSFPAPVPQRGVPAGAVVLLGLVVAAGAYIGWYRMSENRHTPVHTVPPIPARLAQSSDKPPPGPSPQVASILPATAPPGPPLAPPSGTGAAAAASAAATAALATRPATPGPSAAPPTAATTAPAPADAAGGATRAASVAEGAATAGRAPLASAPPASASLSSAPGPGASPPGAIAAASGQSAPPHQSPAPDLAPAGAAPGPAAASGTANAAVTGMPSGTRIVLRATGDAWVQVRQKQGPVLLNRILHAGDTWPVPPDKPQLVLTTGNAGDTVLIVDGTATPPLGKSGAVRRDLLLDPDQIKSGHLVSLSSGRVAKPPSAASDRWQD